MSGRNRGRGFGRGRGRGTADGSAGGESNDNWTMEQQSALDGALRKHPSSMPAKQRWKLIAADVEGKGVKECAARFKYIRAQAQPRDEKEAEQPQSAAAPRTKASCARRPKATAPKAAKKERRATQPVISGFFRGNVE